MKQSLQASLLLALLLLAHGTDAWGVDGHQIVAQIAQNRLTDTAWAQVSDIIGGQNLSEVATWADEVRDTDEYKWSFELHFINVPDGECSFVYERDCVDDVCVAGAVGNYTEQLTDANATVAAFFLIHFMGDMHQPMHAAWAGDLGGNLVVGLDITSWDTKCSSRFDVNLHSVWDTCILNRYAEANFGVNDSDNTRWAEYAAAMDDEISASEATEWGQYDGVASVDAWAQESVGYACDVAYTNTDGGLVRKGDELAKDYYERGAKVVNQRLQQAGVRLAAILNEVFQ